MCCREFHTHLQDSVHEAASVVADFNKFIHCGTSVTEQDLDSTLSRTISSRPQELAVALGTVNDAYNDLLKGASAVCLRRCPDLSQETWKGRM